MLFARRVGRRFVGVLAALAMVAAMLSATAGTAAAASDDVGAVFVLTNAASGNAVAVFDRAADGSLTAAGEVATGGLGTGAGLGSQGALALSHNKRWLFAVNAASNTVSVFKTNRGDLTLVGTFPSGGQLPISLTVHKNVLYVLNAGGSGNITGFTIDHTGALTPVADSTQPLSNNGVGVAPGPAEVQFSPDGNLLVVTEKATNLIDTYVVNEDGMAEAPQTHASAGQTPFGFAFSNRGDLIVSEAFGGAANQSALSSYNVDTDDGSVDVVSPSVATHQTAACWVVVSKDGRYAYATNAGSNDISAYRVGRDGSLKLIGNGNAGATGVAPTDAALSRNGRFLYALGSRSGNITGFRIQPNGSLTPVGVAGNLASGAVGLAAL